MSGKPEEEEPAIISTVLGGRHQPGGGREVQAPGAADSGWPGGQQEEGGRQVDLVFLGNLLTY